MSDPRFLLVLGTNFDCKSVSDSTDFTWQQHQTWQIHVHVPHPQFLIVTHILCWNETNCVRMISELILRAGTAQASGFKRLEEDVNVCAVQLQITDLPEKTFAVPGSMCTVALQYQTFTDVINSALVTMQLNKGKQRQEEEPE